jgi:Bacterial EndoU nuclease
VNMVVNGIKVTVSVFRGRNKDFSGSVHGAQQGPAINKVEWKQGPDGTWGWFAKITINEASEQADINKMAVHEFNEVADIVAREDANVQNGTHNDPSGVFDPTKLNGAVSGHQQASVFKQGANPAAISAANLSSHDLAAAKELEVVMNEAEAALGTPDEGRQLTRVRQLMESMGMLYTGAPQFAMLAAPPINMSIPPKVKAYLDTHVGKDADQQMLMNKFHTHVKTLDWNGKTISGGHDHSVFQAEVAANAHKIQVDAAPVPGLQAGVLTYTYRPKDAAGVVDMDPAKAKKKTTYDPSIWPDSRLINSATEAFASRTYGRDPDIGDYWEGTASDGSKIRGLFTGTRPNIQVTTFWPL